MDWKDYEETVKNIYQALGATNGVEIECYGNSCKSIGKSGVPHQIDVITKHTNGVHTYRTAIECKYWNNKIDKDIIMKAWAIRDDGDFDKSIVVSKNGFTPDAIKYANYKGIGLVELREPLKKDLENRINNISIDICPVIPEIQSYRNIVHEEESQEEMSFQVNTSESYYLFRDGSQKKIIDIVNDFVMEVDREGKFNEVTEKRVSFPEGTYLNSNNPEVSIRVKEVQLKGILMKGGMERVEFRWEDRVWLIMKSIFERKIFVVSPQGEIEEIPFL